MAEEVEKSSITEDQSDNKARVLRENQQELEDGEIIDDDATSSKKAVVTHPLKHSWTFRFDTSARNKEAPWGTYMRVIYTFSTVEDFWRLYNNIHHPSKLSMRTDLYCFKHEIVPKWEDPICANGGTWTMSFSKEKSDTFWLYTLLAMIGEQFTHGDEICGAVVSVRSKLKISLWTKNAGNESAQISIAKQWKEFLEYNDPIGFIFHEDAIKHDRESLRGSVRNRYTV